MAIYIDDLKPYPGRKGRWCHMSTDKDGNLEELHQMAEHIGLQRMWFQDHRCPHYDVCGVGRRSRAISNGAIEVSGHELIKRCLR